MKKKAWDYYTRERIFPGTTKILLKMKLTFIMILLSFLGTIASESYSQTTRLSLELKNETVEQVLETIEEKSDFYFLYSAEMIDVNRKLSINVLNSSVEKVLDLLFEGTDITYVVKNRQIVLSPGKDLTIQQQHSVSGKVTDSSGAPLPGVTVSVKNTTQGTITDAQGNYSLVDVPGNGILVFSFVGMKTQEIAAGGKKDINVTMKEEAIGIEEVVAIGYQSLKKSDVTGSVSSISSDDIVQYPVSGPQMGLQGKTPGVSVVPNSGAPGAPINVRIRGSNSIMGNNEPLYVVDGFALAGTPGSINPNDIQSIEILKDASSTAIYGSRGANGVILITTKSGKIGKTNVVLDSYYAVQEVSETIDMMNAREFAEIANERAANDGGTPYFTQDDVNSFSEGTNWQDELFRAAPMQNHFLSFSGGSDDTQYFISGNIFDQNGIIPNSSLNKISIRVNISRKVSKKFTLSLNTNLMHSDLYTIDINGQKGGTTLSAALVAPPTIAPYTENGQYSEVRAYSFSPNELDNPLAMAKERKQLTDSKNVMVNSTLAYEPVKDLIFKTSIGIESDVSRENYYSSKSLDRTPTGSGRISSMDMMNILNENILTYTKNFNNIHNINALAGVTYQENEILTYNTGSVTGFLTDEMGEYNLGAGSQVSMPASNLSNWVLLSFLGRINYSYKDTYLLTASVRSDGSSRFAKGNRWGYFPSAAIAWRIMNEDFMKGMNTETISNLKFRLSWGITGNTGISPYQTLNTLQTYSTVFNDSRYIGFAPNNRNLANPDLEWEKTSQANAGIDLGILNDRISVTIDYYQKDTRDLLAYTQLPTSSGYKNTISNVGKIQNKGIEAGLFAVISDRKFKWSVNANFTKNKSEVVSLPGGSDIMGDAIPQPLAVSVNMLREGEPVGVFYGYLEDGLDNTGAIKYKDTDGKPGITTGDRTIIGDPNPDFTYNLRSTLSYKKFDLDFMFQGVSGGDIFNVNITSVGNSFYFGENQLKEVYSNHWSTANPDPNAKYPKISTKTVFSASDRFVEDGSYLRLKNIQLGYNFSFPKIGIKGEIYVSGQNLLTLTNYSWYDPEVNTRGGSTSFSNGIDNLGYPIPKIYTFGASLQF
ncbi:MAG: TonB-dependent receptor [Mangrovibacterium sp.]